MLDKMAEFVNEGRTEKVFRWLGFVQGVLWTNRVYTLTELKDHNRPESQQDSGAPAMQACYDCRRALFLGSNLAITVRKVLLKKLGKKFHSFGDFTKEMAVRVR